MTAVDSSVCVAAFSSWHEHHEVARRTLAARPRLIGHVAFETYAVLTRLPPPHRSPGPAVAEFLEGNFTGAMLLLPGGEQRRLLAELAAGGIVGGAAYDALIAATAKHAGEVLETLDRHALSTYGRIGARVVLLA